MYTLFGWAVEYCYTGGVEGLQPQDALDLWTLAEFLQMDGLQRVCEAAAAPAAPFPSDAGAGAGGPTLLGARYALGLAYPSGKALRLGVAREVLGRWAAAGLPPAPAPGEAKQRPWEVGPDVGALLAAHPQELAADLAEALAQELKQLC